MSYIKEPEGVYFTIESPPLTEKEKEEISDFIRKKKSQTSEKDEVRKVSHKKSSAE